MSGLTKPLLYGELTQGLFSPSVADQNIYGNYSLIFTNENVLFETEVGSVPEGAI